MSRSAVGFGRRAVGVSLRTVGVSRRAVTILSGVSLMDRTVFRSRRIDNCGVEHSATFGSG